MIEPPKKLYGRGGGDLFSWGLARTPLLAAVHIPVVRWNRSWQVLRAPPCWDLGFEARAL